MRKPLVVIDLTGVASIGQLHQMLSNALEFLGWYGENWDAFWDSITALVEMPEQLRLIGWNSFETRFPRDAKIMKECLDDLSKQLAALAAHVEYS